MIDSSASQPQAAVTAVLFSHELWQLTSDKPTDKVTVIIPVQV